MTDRMFLLPPEAWSGAARGDDVEVVGAEGRHAVAVVRIRAGETVLLSDGAGRRAEATVMAVGRASFVARLDAVTEEAQRRPRLVLVQALAKGARDEQAVEAATELGVDEVVPWQAGRSIVQWRGERAAKGEAKWRSVVTAATKQSRRAFLPTVAPLADRAAVVERVEASALALVLDGSATTRLADIALPSEGDITVVVGPEGGIAPEELEAFTAAGAVAVRLGAEVLRSSTAGPAALAVLSARLWW